MYVLYVNQITMYTERCVEIRARKYETLYVFRPVYRAKRFKMNKRPR